MSRGARVTQRDLDRDPALAARVAAALDRDTAAESQRDGQPALGGQGARPSGLVDIPGPLRVRITRVYAGRHRPYDDDNMSGGCKSLRDAIAAALGRKGDSEEDGLAWEYAQEKGPEAETIIEIWED